MFRTLLTIVVFSTIAHSTEISNGETKNVDNTASLKVEARGDSDALSINAIDEKSENSVSTPSVIDKSDKQPIILGATSKVAIVYSERKSSASDEKQNVKAPRVVYPLKQGSVSVKQASNDRNWRVVKASSRDSYLDALEHSHSKKDPSQDVTNVDSKKKMTNAIRRDYNEGPVYRHPHEQYGGPKEPISSYGLPQEVSNRLTTTKNVARISYGGPTPEPFFPTPSNSYSLPIQSSVSFNNNNDNDEFYASPQISYGSPTPQTQIYSSYSNGNYNKVPSNPQHYYGPPNNGYPSAGIPQQVYGPPPSSTYGVPHAIQDYSQHFPSLMPSIDLSWPFALKLNAFTLAKILLKLVIFKMIVKFIALICLLLFIPKLEIKKGEGNDDSDDSDDSRRLFSKDSNLERLNMLTEFVTSAIENYNKSTDISGKPADNCTNFGCRVSKFLTHEETWNDYVRLFKSYVEEENNYNEENRQLQSNHVDS